MRRLGKILGVLSIVGLLLLVSVISFGAWTVHRSYPQTSGELRVPGLAAPVSVLRDERGVPDIYAESPADLFFAQGYVHAQDRFWEMDFRRHVTAGRLSELFGASQVDTDKFLRISGWRKVAEAELPLLSRETRDNLNSYSKGVNAYLADHSGATVSLEYAILGLQNPRYSIEPWSAVDSIAWLKAMAWELRGNMQEEIDRTLIAAKVGVSRAEQLYPPYPFERNRPIVAGGSVLGGVFRASDGPAGEAAASVLPVAVAGSESALLRARAALTSLDPVLGPSGPGIGSNSWVISGAKTDTGKPLLANDPHLGPVMPSIWYQMGLHCATVSSTCPYDVSGYTFSGTPGVVIGHNATIAWGFTNLGPDVADLYLEKIEGNDYVVDGVRKPLTVRTETIKVAGGDPVELMVRSTPHGPLVSDGSDQIESIGKDAQVPGSAPDRGAGYAVALRWTALTPGRTADAISGLNTAKTWTDFRSAASKFEVPAQNMIFASTDGTIGYQAPGRIPIRSGYNGRYPALGWDSSNDWVGYIPFGALPSVRNPADGWVVTANQAAIGPDYPYLLTDDWAYGARSQRIVDRITVATSGSAKISAATIREIQFDSYNSNAAFLVPKIAGASVSGKAAEALRLFAGWDFTQPATSAPAAYFNAFWRALLARTIDTQVPNEQRAAGGDRYFEAIRKLWNTPDDPWWDDARTPTSEGRDAAVAGALQSAADELTGLQGGDVNAWSWGALHTLTVRNASFGDSGISLIEAVFNRGPVRTSGGESIVNATGWTAYDGYEVDWVPSMRMVIDVADFDRSTWVNLTGSSGHAYSPHYVDQLDAWAAGQTFPFPFGRAAVDNAAKDRLTLIPG